MVRQTVCWDTYKITAKYCDSRKAHLEQQMRIPHYTKKALKTTLTRYSATLYNTRNTKEDAKVSTQDMQAELLF